jgi:hypothetical protein
VIGEVMVAVVEAVFPLPSLAAAAITQEPAVSGAVNDPEVGLMTPQDALQVTGAVAENCCTAPSLSWGLLGETVSVGGAPPMVSIAVAV